MDLRPACARVCVWSVFQCLPGGRDYVEVLGGLGLDTASMTRFAAMCGLQADSGTSTFRLSHPSNNCRYGLLHCMPQSLTP